MKKFTPITSSLDDMANKIINLDHLPDRDPDASNCPHCDGYGHIIDENGKARPCVCVRNEIIKSGIEEAHIPVKFKDSTLDSFDPYEFILKQRLGQARQYVENYSTDNSKGLFICGTTGTGKTHLAIGILKGLIKRGFDGGFFNVVELLDSIRSSFDPNATAPPRVRLTQELERQIIILDDFGVEKTSTWVVDRLYAIINRRYQDCKTIIITSNIHMDNIAERVERRLTSRIYDMCDVLDIQAPDFRQKNSQSQGRRG